MNYHILNEIQKCKGFNKSSLFLYPLMGLNDAIKPLNTYLGFANVNIGCSLVMLFHKTQPDYSKWVNELTRHQFFDYTIEEDDYIYYVYNLSAIENTYNCIKRGHYSKIEPSVKTLLNIKDQPLVHIAINPELFYDALAEQLQCSVEQLRINVEIITAPNPDEEYIHINSKLVEEINQF